MSRLRKTQNYFMSIRSSSISLRNNRCQILLTSIPYSVWCHFDELTSPPRPPPSPKGKEKNGFFPLNSIHWSRRIHERNHAQSELYLKLSLRDGGEGWGEVCSDVEIGKITIRATDRGGSVASGTCMHVACSHGIRGET